MGSLYQPATILSSELLVEPLMELLTQVILFLSSDILRRPQKIEQSSTFYLTLLSKVKFEAEDCFIFGGLIKISELKKKTESSDKKEK